VAIEFLLCKELNYFAFVGGGWGLVVWGYWGLYFFFFVFCFFVFGFISLCPLFVPQPSCAVRTALFLCFSCFPVLYPFSFGD